MRMSSQSGRSDINFTPEKSVESFNGEDRESTADESGFKMKKDDARPGTLKFEIKDKFPEIYELAMSEDLDKSIF